MRDEGFYIDDFSANGILLPMLPSVARQQDLPVHIGPHPNYNAQIISQLQSIRVFCESVRSESCRRRLALAGVRGVQKRALIEIVGQRADHVNHIRLASVGIAKLIEAIDKIFTNRSEQPTDFA
jgi:A nuclease family of the HNH/ENDO VII superfamily with conserved AHH